MVNDRIYETFFLDSLIKICKHIIAKAAMFDRRRTVLVAGRQVHVLGYLLSDVSIDAEEVFAVADNATQPTGSTSPPKGPKTFTERKRARLLTLQSETEKNDHPSPTDHGSDGTEGDENEEGEVE